MRRVAAKRVYVSENEFHDNHVVELIGSFPDRTASRHYPLDGELPMTEWLDGIIVLTPSLFTPAALRGISRVADFFPAPPLPHAPSDVSCADIPPCRALAAYHVTCFDLSRCSLTAQSAVARL